MYSIAVYPSLDLTNEPVRPLVFTKSCNSLNPNWSYYSKVVRDGICLLNQSISLYQDSLNQYLSVFDIFHTVLVVMDQAKNCLFDDSAGADYNTGHD